MQNAFSPLPPKAFSDAASLLFDRFQAQADTLFQVASDSINVSIEQGRALSRATTPEAIQAALVDGLGQGREQASRAFQAGQDLFAGHMKAANDLGAISRDTVEKVAKGPARKSR